ncbi:hypothetical protein [Plantactinospora soyae]|uniref:Secreted protein n=1 Tax=Plantactinospora soyae TaxID=1544732 RepID=A0A927RAP5_9ACTN|nr:hypothetical protein [Plantactinospora soyae]MBE1492569.1 hypothetical protein [Plantactinospora soyae]
MSSLLSRKRVLGGLVAAGVLTVGIAAPAVAFAEDGATPAPSPSASSDPGTTPQGQDQRAADRRGKLAEQLATELGVPQDKVEAALTKITQQRQAERKDQGSPDGKSGADREAWLKTRLDKAVSDGKLTREQADAIVAAFQAGVLPAWGGGPGHRGGWTGAKHDGSKHEGSWTGPKHDGATGDGATGGPADGGQSDTPAAK